MKNQKRQYRNKQKETLSYGQKKSKEQQNIQLPNKQNKLQTNKENQEIKLTNQSNTYDQFMQMFKQKKEDPQIIQKISKKVKTNEHEPSELIISPYKKIKFQQRENADQQNDYFSYDFKNINALKEIYSVLYHSKFFILNQKLLSKQHKEQGQTYEEEILTNSVNLQNFKIKKEYKERNEFYSSNSIETILLDKLSEQSMQTNGILANPKLESKIKQFYDSHKLNALENELFIMASDLYDLFYIDHKEKIKESFIDMMACHILNHLSRSNLEAKNIQDNIEEEETEEAKEQAKEETKEEAKKEAKEETKEEIKEETKEEIKEESKEEIQNEVKEEQKPGKKLHNFEEDQNDENYIKTKGYTRPKILILTPNKLTATQIIKKILHIYTKGNLKSIGHKSRFFSEFNEEQELEDNFKIGIAFNQKHIKLYSAFVESDIIIGSPLGLKLALDESSETNYSILSSIEIALIYQADAIYMQNWEHLTTLFANMNLIPKHSDISTELQDIRLYFFEGFAKLFRQTIVYTERNFPELQSFRINYCDNYKGVIQNKPNYQYVIEEYQLKQMNNFNCEFIKLEISNHFSEFDKRLEYFKNKVFYSKNFINKKIWNKINDNKNVTKTVIYVNTYFEFVKLRKFFKAQNADIYFISEYTEPKKVQSQLAKFNKNVRKFLLFNERAYYFNMYQFFYDFNQYLRANIRNMHNIIFFQIPKFEYIFQEIILSLNDPQTEENKPSFKNQVICLFSQYDYLALERIVGSVNAKEYLSDYNKSTTFII